MAGSGAVIIVSYYRLMEREPQTIKTEHVPLTLPAFEGSRCSKHSHLTKFRLSHASERHHRTEPSVENLREELPKRHCKNGSDFSEEYMSLVNKLRVNLSRELEKKPRVEVFRERQYLFNSENKKAAFLTKHTPKQIQQHYPRESLRISNFKKRSFTTFSQNMEATGPKSFRNCQGLPEESFYKLSEDGLKREKSFLPSMSKGRYELNDVINEVTEQNSPEIAKRKAKGKPQTTKKQKEKPTLIVKPGEGAIVKSGEGASNHAHQQHSIEQDLKQLNEDYGKIDELCFHIEVLIDIFEHMNYGDNVQEKPERVIKLLKGYVLGNKKSVGSSVKLLMDDISHLDRIFKQEKQQKLLRTLVFYQRILVISCIDLLANCAIARHQPHINTILHSLLGTYLYLVYLRSQSKHPLPDYAQSCLSSFHAKTSEHNIHIKRELQTSVFFVSKKLSPLLKANPALFKQIKVLVAQFQSRNVTINRAFYQLLRLFAVYINNHEALLEKHYQSLKTFATCPSPYLTKPASKRYTLVLDLDETLIHSHRHKHKLDIFMRPFLKEFLQVMARNYELVVFTSSMPEYSEQIIAQLPHISHRLFRYHTTRLRHRHIKDLSRLGRPLQSVVMVDNEEENFLLQKQNGIRIAEWIGDNPHDQQLNVLGLFLNQLAQKGVSDVREHLASFRQFRSNRE